jgi:hypothetical protein
MWRIGDFFIDTIIPKFTVGVYPISKPLIHLLRDLWTLRCIYE